MERGIAMPNAPMTIAQRKRASGQAPVYPKRTTDASRFRDTAAWQKVRKVARQTMPLCVDPFGNHASCGRFEATEDIHHVQSVEDRPDLAYMMDNLRGLCRLCHARVSGLERAGQATVHLFERRDDDTGC